MSLVHMNCNTPKTGSTSADYMCWGVYNTVVSGLAQKRYFPYIGSSPNSVTIYASVNFQTEHIYLPSDSKGENGLNNWTNTNPSNSNEHFCYSNTSYRYMCSPYKQDGSKDERYFSTSNTGNVFADFDGRSNTDKIIAERGSKDYSSWTPSTSSQSDYPAASCCDMFSTVGTNQGDWYLPAAGELGYAVARMQAIQNSMQALVTKGYTAGSLSNSIYWSSTLYSSIRAVDLDFNYGYVGYSSKNYDSICVRSFLAL